MIVPPRIGSAIVLRDLGEAAYASRVESVEKDLLTVVKPVGVPAAYPYPPGTPFDVLWTEPTGQHVLPTELAGTRSEGAVLLWDLRPVEAPWIDQRREFVRVAAFGRVALWLDDDADGSGENLPTRREGYLVDVSEAAMHASIWAEPEDPMLTSGSRGVVEFTAHGTGFTRAGVILGVRPGADGHEMTVIFRFDQAPSEATELRRAVFAAQIDLRHRWRREADS